MFRYVDKIVCIHWSGKLFDFWSVCLIVTDCLADEVQVHTRSSFNFRDARVLKQELVEICQGAGLVSYLPGSFCNSSSSTQHSGEQFSMVTGKVSKKRSEWSIILATTKFVKHDTRYMIHQIFCSHFGEHSSTLVATLHHNTPWLQLLPVEPL